MRFIELGNWEMEVEENIEIIAEKIVNEKENYGKEIYSFFMYISSSLSLHGEIYENKKFILFLEEETPYYSPLKIIHKESIDISNTKFYTYGTNFFIIKKSGNEFTLTKYGYNIKEAKLEILDKVKLENCF